MKENRYSIILAITLLIIFIGGLISYKVYQLQQNAKYFDLSSKCMRDAKSFFNEKYPGVEFLGPQIQGPMYFADYQNHYNKRLNKCYILITTHFGTVDMGHTYLERTELYDVGDRALIGELNINGKNQKDILCKLYGKECQSVDDFITGIEPYIENKIDL